MSTISPDLEHFVQQEISSGRFADRDAVIAHALRLLQQDREAAIAGIRRGLEEMAAGRGQPLDAAFADLRNDLHSFDDE